MNVPDLRNVDFDFYRQRARELQIEAIETAIDRASAWLKKALHRQHRAIAVSPVRAAV